MREQCDESVNNFSSDVLGATSSYIDVEFLEATVESFVRQERGWGINSAQWHFQRVFRQAFFESRPVLLFWFCRYNHLFCWSYSASWFHKHVEVKAQHGMRVHCTFTPPEFLRWEAYSIDQQVFCRVQNLAPVMQLCF